METEIDVIKKIGPNKDAQSMHFHYTCEMIFVERGFLVMSVDGVSCMVKEGDLLIISNLETHTLDSESFDCTRYIFRFSTEFLFEMVKDPSLIIIFNRSSSLSIPLFEIDEKNISTIKQLFSLLMIEFNMKDDFYDTRCGVLLSAILIALFRMNSNIFVENRNPMLTKIYEIQKYLNQNYMKNTTLDEISSTYSISISHLEHSFRKVTGLSIKRYILLTRISNAKKRLCSSDDSISQISEKTGFYDSNYFIKQFKKVENITPLQYRKKFFQSNPY